MVDWSNLPGELVILISEKLDSEFYILRFRSVCTTWRGLVPKPHNLPYNFPKNTVISIPSCISKRSFFLIKPHNQFPWLIKSSQDSRPKTRLWNPVSFDSCFHSLFFNYLNFTQFNVLDLGHYFVHHYYFYPVKLVVATWQRKEQPPSLLTFNPTGQLAMFRSGDHQLTLIPDGTGYIDICVSKGRPYAVASDGRMVTIGPDYSVCLAAEPILGGNNFKFLVECDGELLLVQFGGGACSLSFWEHENDVDDNDCKNADPKIDVFRLDKKKKKWVELTSLGDKVLFLGDKCGFAVSASDLCVAKGNCVIFETKEDILKPLECEMSVYHLDHKGWIQPLSDYLGYSNLFWPPPDWTGFRDFQKQLLSLKGLCCE
ncbi:F-box protein [Trifolium pratense]|uniref:Uncharacterized protein n=2 Tax=Trifolium pratense TaxID=57577 RepID=A0ACB0J6T4_TRIPR|nr:F-box protein SKIP23-like [Trifolium pratense]PNX97217.1 F-box protein [Trifolium pratense]CAJ2639137.1 unnamed protein product [Trifolium pratense]